MFLFSLWALLVLHSKLTIFVILYSGKHEQLRTQDQLSWTIGINWEHSKPIHREKQTETKQDRNRVKRSAKMCQVPKLWSFELGAVAAPGFVSGLGTSYATTLSCAVLPRPHGVCHGRVGAHCRCSLCEGPREVLDSFFYAIQILVFSIGLLDTSGNKNYRYVEQYLNKLYGCVWRIDSSETAWGIPHYGESILMLKKELFQGREENVPLMDWSEPWILWDALRFRIFWNGSGWSRREALLLRLAAKYEEEFLTFSNRMQAKSAQYRMLWEVGASGQSLCSGEMGRQRLASARKPMGGVFWPKF